MIKINLQIIEECKSTNASLIKLANEGYPEGYSLLSLNQTCGKGTGKKKWISISGNLFLSTLRKRLIFAGEKVELERDIS